MPRKHVDIEALRQAEVPEDTIFRFLQPELVEWEKLEDVYSAVLSLVQVLIGTVPSCDVALGIWPPAFAVYNTIVPNFLQLPESLLGVSPLKSTLQSLIMYSSSKANECAYCTSHCCSYSLRRGVTPEKVLAVLDEEQGIGNDKLSPEERAVVQFGVGVGSVPTTLEVKHVQELKALFTREQMEWCVAASAMFGSFNKFMDGLGIPLEPDTYQETVPHMGGPKKFRLNSATGMAQTDAVNAHGVPDVPVDDWRMKLFVIYQGLRPGGALQLDGKLQAKTPHPRAERLLYLQELTGCPNAFESILSQVTVDRFQRAIITVLAYNFDSSISTGGIMTVSTKLGFGIMYCKDVLQNERLASELKRIATCVSRSETKTTTSAASPLLKSVAKAVMYTPNRMTRDKVLSLQNQYKKQSSSSVITPSMIVELVSFLAAVQMMHRIETFFNVLNAVEKMEGM